MMTTKLAIKVRPEHKEIIQLNSYQYVFTLLGSNSLSLPGARSPTRAWIFEAASWNCWGELLLPVLSTEEPHIRDACQSEHFAKTPLQKYVCMHVCIFIYVPIGLAVLYSTSLCFRFFCFQIYMFYLFI